MPPLGSLAAKRSAYVEAGGGVSASTTDPRLTEWIKRRAAAARDRARYEHIWHLCQAFVQGHQWVRWDPEQRRVFELSNPDDRVRHTVNVITQHVQTQQGKLVLDDARPDVTFARDDIESESYAEQARRAHEFAWNEEADADEAFWRASMKRLTYGLGAIRVRRDPFYGPVIGRIPHTQDGQPLDEEQLAVLEQTGALPDGSLPKFKTMREGRVHFEPLGPFHLLPPPGVEHEDDFPWLIVERPMPLPVVRSIYGDAAAGLVEEALRTVDTTGLRSMEGDRSMGSGKLTDHVLVRTGYEMPTDEHPKGQTIVWAQNQVLDHADELPVQVNGEYHHGIRFFKYLPVEGRFWPIGLVQPTVGVQQQRNEARSLAIEIIERGGFPWLMAHKGVVTEKNVLQGIPFQVMELLPGSEMPKVVEGVGPGGWIREEKEMNDEDMRQVTGTGDVSLSQAPTGVSAYAAFALLVEQDDRRIGPIRKADRKELVECSKAMLWLIKQTWPDEKRIAVAGEHGMMDEFVFSAAQLPDRFYVRFPNSAPLPQSQAAIAQMTMDVFDRSIGGGQTLPLDWLVDSLLGGKMQPLPKREMQVQQDNAEYENMLIGQGRLDLVMVKPYDNDQLHVHFHRACQTAYATIPGYQGLVQLIEQHIQQHLMNAEMKANQQVPTNNGQQAAPGGGSGGQNAGMGPLEQTMSAGAALTQ